MFKRFIEGFFSTVFKWSLLISAPIALGDPQPSDPPETELERQTIAALIDIAAEGDKAITNAPTGCAALLSTAERFLFALGASSNPRLVKWSDVSVASESES